MVNRELVEGLQLSTETTGKSLRMIEKPEEFEFICCKMTTLNSEFYIASVYHPPDPIYNANEVLNLCPILVIVPCRVILMLRSLLLAM